MISKKYGLKFQDM